MEIVLKTKPKKKITITRDKHSGIIRVDEEACILLEDILNKLEHDMSVCQLASTLIKAAVENSIIREEGTDE
jgi:hypothetical protein